MSMSTQPLLSPSQRQDSYLDDRDLQHALDSLEGSAKGSHTISARPKRSCFSVVCNIFSAIGRLFKRLFQNSSSAVTKNTPPRKVTISTERANRDNVRDAALRAAMGI